MFRVGWMICVFGVLAACADPLASVPRLQDVELAETDPAAAALPSEEEIEREGFFGTDAAQPDEVSRQPAQTGSGPSAGRGLFGWFRYPAAQERTPGPGILPQDNAPADSSEAEVAAAVGAATQATSDAAALDAQPGVRRGGFFSRLTRRTSPAIAPEPETPTEDSPSVVASLETTPTVEPTPQPERRGLFSRLSGNGGSAPAESNLLEVDYGTAIPYGIMARSCASKRKNLGRKVDASAGFTLYDTNPASTAPRTFYITGFGDGCPRQITAAQALLGAPSFYEQLHYGPAGADLSIGDTDRAYEKVKRQVCGARKGKPCGAKMKQLERSTVFVNTYQNAKMNSRWSEVLIHDGEVVAQSSKSSG